MLAGLPTMISQASYEMIPGLQLVDRDFILRVDATGRSQQQHDLYRDLLPRVGAMLSQKLTAKAPKAFHGPGRSR